MKLQWKKIKGFENYLITNYGEILNTKTSRFIKTFDAYVYRRNSGYKLRNDSKFMCCALYLNGKHYVKSLAKLVLQHFKRNNLPDEISLHLDLDGDNNKINNLKWANRSMIIRYKHPMNNKKRGVYKFKGNGNKKWRVNFINKNGENKNFGYYYTKKEAETAFQVLYQKEFGFFPYIRNNDGR